MIIFTNRSASLVPIVASRKICNNGGNCCKPRGQEQSFVDGRKMNLRKGNGFKSTRRTRRPIYTELEIKIQTWLKLGWGHRNFENEETIAVSNATSNDKRGDGDGSSWRRWRGLIVSMFWVLRPIQFIKFNCHFAPWSHVLSCFVVDFTTTMLKWSNPIILVFWCSVFSVSRLACLRRIQILNDPSPSSPPFESLISAPKATSRRERTCTLLTLNQALRTTLIASFWICPLFSSNRVSSLLVCPQS